MKKNRKYKNLIAEKFKSSIGDGTAAFPSNFHIYLWSWSQYILYPVIGFVSWWHLRTQGSLLWSLPLGFALYNVWMTGHDACHDLVFNTKRSRLNEALAFLTLDCTLVTQKTWVQTHHKEHHPFPNSSIDGQRLEGDGLLEEFWNAFRLLLSYLWMDFLDFIKFPTLVKGFTLCLRYALLLSLGWALPFTLFWLILFASYFGLLSHSISPLPNAKGFRQKQLSNTADLLPGNWLAEFCTGGLNSHAVHHVWPQLPRGLHGWASKRLKELEPEYYRSFNSMTAVFSFWRNRQNPKPKSKLPSPDVYYKTQAL